MSSQGNAKESRPEMQEQVAAALAQLLGLVWFSSWPPSLRTVAVVVVVWSVLSVFLVGGVGLWIAMWRGRRGRNTVVTFPLRRSHRNIT